MSTKKSKLDEIGRVNPFKVPEGYFEQFSGKMISKLPERAVEEPKVFNLWEKMKPWAYMAAMFIGMALMFKVFMKTPDQGAGDQSIQAKSEISIKPSEIEDFYTYYEDQLATDVYRQEAYLEIHDPK